MEKEKRLLLLRYGELWLKSFEVQRRFKDRLLTNISEMFREEEIPVIITASRDRIFVEVNATDFKKSATILSHTFGLVSFSPVSKIPAEKDAIFKAVLDIARKSILPKDTFAVRAQRSGEHGFTSSELERECGAKVVGLLGNKVNLTKPDKTIFVDVRDRDAYVFSEKVPAAGGLPLGVEGKLVAPYSGDFQKWAVASYVMMKRGCRILPVFEHEGKDSKKAIAFLREFDLIATPYFSEAKNPDMFALKLCWKKKAEGIVLSDGIEAFYGKRKLKMFDRKARIPYLYPLVGITEEEIKSLYASIIE